MAAPKHKRKTKTAALLQSLGFTDYEAAAYLLLLEHHPATAYEIGRLGGLVKANVYPTLESLARRGAIQPISKEPTRYVPVDPKIFLKSVAKSTTALCEELATDLAQTQASESVEYVWMLSNEKDIHQKFAQMIAQAKQHIWIKGPVHLLTPHRVALKKAAMSGTKILIILFGNENNARSFRYGPNCKVYLHESSGMQLVAGENRLIAATDYEEALSAELGQTFEGAFTRNQSIVYLAESLIRHEIYLAEIIKRYKTETEASFGKALINLRQQYLPRQVVQELKNRLTK